MLVAHHHAATRAGVHESLESGDFAIVGETADAAGAVELALRERPDVCLLDPEMPGNGIKAAETTSEVPVASVVTLSRCDRTGGLLDALRAGAVGYLLLETDPARLPHALHGVISGEAAIPRRLVSRLIEEFRAREARRTVPVAGGEAAELTLREWEVVEMMRNGSRRPRWPIACCSHPSRCAGTSRGSRRSQPPRVARAARRRLTEVIREQLYGPGPIKVFTGGRPVPQ